MDTVLTEDLLTNFPIDLDEKLRDIGYRRRRTVIKRLIREYREKSDFIIFRINPSSKRDIYLLSEDCYDDIKRRDSLPARKEKQVQKELIESETLSVEKENYLIDDTVGRLDILTDEEVIEVEPAKAWKDALGQVLVYRTYFEDKKARIHLFISLKDKESQVFAREEEREKIENCCEKLNVKVSWHEPELPKFIFQQLLIEGKSQIVKTMDFVAFFCDEFKKITRFLHRKDSTFIN